MQFLYSVVTCSDRSLSNGHVSFDRDSVDNGQYPVNTISTFRCKDGYSVFGHNSSTCEISGRWSQPIPHCGGKEIYSYLRSITVFHCNVLSWPEGADASTHKCVCTLPMCSEAEIFGLRVMLIRYLQLVMYKIWLISYISVKYCLQKITLKELKIW